MSPPTACHVAHSPVIAEVIATYGRHVLLRDASGMQQQGRPIGRALDIVCGDVVRCQTDTDEWLVQSIEPRRTVLRRSSLRGRSETLAANLTQLAIVLAPLPLADFFLIDRYLSAAECAGLAAILVANKSDLPASPAYAAGLAQYGALGYTAVETQCSASADASAALAPLHVALAGHTSILVGQSGVGKSSLTRLLAHTAADTAIGLLVREEEGRHTTTASRLHDCDAGGRIMDSPGVRDFAPAIDDLEPRALGFREIGAAASDCRFQDCKHMHEPGCAVAMALEQGRIDAHRYESYRRLRRLYEQLWDKRPARERAARR